MSWRRRGDLFLDIRPSWPIIFFFQAEDGIRDRNETGVQTCALPICKWPSCSVKISNWLCGIFSFCVGAAGAAEVAGTLTGATAPFLALFVAGAGVLPTSSIRKIGRASCRERV